LCSKPQQMQNVVFTQLSIPELKELFRQELAAYFSGNQLSEQPQTDQMLTIQEAGQLISLSVPTIYGLVSRSEIPVSKKGKRLYFSKLELIDWIKSGRKRTQAEAAGEANNYVTANRK
jgi:excisionase family DNA binding protein